MRNTKVDYILVGQGLAGSWLAHEMIQRNLTIVVINHDKPETSSLKAAGIYNPITGRKMIKTWRADQLFPSLEASYTSLEQVTGKRFLNPVPIYRPFRIIEDQNDWEGRLVDSAYRPFLKKMLTASMGLNHIQDSLGGIIINQSGYVNIPVMLEGVKNFLTAMEIYRSEMFDCRSMEIESNSVTYKGFTAKKVIFCEGALSANPFWELPFKPVRGEVIDITCDLNTDYIINQGVFMIPKGDRFTVGSTYDQTNLTFVPQDSGIKSLEERLKKLFSDKYQIIDKRAGVRPATHNRKPYIGLHHKYKTLGIFNGFGTKGVSLTPHFAKHFVDVLQGKSEIDEEVHVQRVI